jgi:hypothetical protein
MKKPKPSKKKVAKKPKASASKIVTAKSKLAAKKKATAKRVPVVKAKAVAKQAAPKKKTRRAPTVLVGNQNVETVQVRPKARVARAGAGGGDFEGVSIVQDVDSESADELLEEGQAFESGIVRGVEEAASDIEQEVHTHEVPQDDVPEEYEDKDRQ